MNAIMNIVPTSNLLIKVIVLISTVMGFGLIGLGAWMYALNYFFEIQISSNTVLSLLGAFSLSICCATAGKIIAPALAKRIKDSKALGDVVLVPFKALWTMALLHLFLGLSFSFATYGKIVAIMVALLILAGIIAITAGVLVVAFKK
jgi:hypothetical protein